MKTDMEKTAAHSLKFADRYRKLTNKLLATGTLARKLSVPLAARKKMAQASWEFMVAASASGEDMSRVYSNFFDVGEVSERGGSMKVVA
jgi:hypothetical protein